MPPPAHHKEIARFLAEKIGGDASVTAYRDNTGRRPVPIGAFGAASAPFISTIGAFDEPRAMPAGDYEFAACGSLAWLPNAIASSIYWLQEREVVEWPLVCEDAVRDNARSTYRHMAYAPSVFALTLSTGQRVQWLLGVPITDSEIGLSLDDVISKAARVHPHWLFAEGA